MGHGSGCLLDFIINVFSFLSVVLRLYVYSKDLGRSCLGFLVSIRVFPRMLKLSSCDLLVVGLRLLAVSWLKIPWRNISLFFFFFWKEKHQSLYGNFVGKRIEELFRMSEDCGKTFGILLFLLPLPLGMPSQFLSINCYRIFSELAAKW